MSQKIKQVESFFFQKLSIVQKDKDEINFLTKTWLPFVKKSLTMLIILETKYVFEKYGMFKVGPIA